jgi:hypothetical protein
VTDAQRTAIVRKIFGEDEISIDLRRIEYNANDRPSYVRFGFYDAGRNWHSVGILPDGKLRTYTE